jgi:hypothetical protein
MRGLPAGAFVQCAVSAYHADKYALYSNYETAWDKQEIWWAASFAVQQPRRLIFGVETKDWAKGMGLRPSMLWPRAARRYAGRNPAAGLNCGHAE